MLIYLPLKEIHIHDPWQIVREDQTPGLKHGADMLPKD